MKLFIIYGHYSKHIICAETQTEAVEIFKKNLYPECVLNDPKYGQKYKEILSSLDISTTEDTEWTIKEFDLNENQYIGCYES